MRRMAAWSLTAVGVSLALLLFFPRYIPEPPRVHAALRDLELLRMAVSMFEKENGRLPDGDAGLAALLTTTPPLIERLPNDTWGHAYVYRSTSGGSGYAVYSVGFNGIDELGQGDDVTDWSKQYSCDAYGVGCPPTLDDLIAYVALALGSVGLVGLVVSMVVAVWRRIRDA
jgi:hypothetical protein